MTSVASQYFTREAFLPLQHLVYVVEDEAGIRNALVTTLKRGGFDVEAFSDAESVATALTDERRPFLVVLDVSLAQSDAVEVLQILSEHQYEGAVQLLSGNTTDLMSDICLVGQRRKLRMLPGLRKPCRMEKVRAIADAESERGTFIRSAPATKQPFRAGVETSLTDALDETRVEVWYQPKFHLSSGLLIGAECLARVRESDGGLALPGSFLPRATPRDMERLTEAVLRRALLDWTEFNASGNRLKLSVNVSCQTLSTFPLATILREHVAKDGALPGLILEITEEDALRDVARAHEAATQLMIYGVQLSIDDFGQGYSSISRLREVPFKEIKLDRSLVQNCATDTKAGALCKGVVDLAHSLRAVVVGEGVETEEDCDFLRRIGCDIVQGYLFGRPMPKRDLLARLADRTYKTA